MKGVALVIDVEFNLSEFFGESVYTGGCKSECQKCNR